MRSTIDLVADLLPQPRPAPVGHGLVERLEPVQALGAVGDARLEPLVDPPVALPPGVGAALGERRGQVFAHQWMGVEGAGARVGLDQAAVGEVGEDQGPVVVGQVLQGFGESGDGRGRAQCIQQVAASRGGRRGRAGAAPRARGSGIGLGPSRANQVS